MGSRGNNICLPSSFKKNAGYRDVSRRPIRRICMFAALGLRVRIHRSMYSACLPIELTFHRGTPAQEARYPGGA
jgi:hypothetical protein